MGRFVKNPQATQGQTLEIPSVSTANRPAGQNGQIIFNSTTSTYQVYNGSQWYNVSEASREKTLTVDKFQGDGSTTVFGGGKGNTLDGSTAATLSVVPTENNKIYNALTIQGTDTYVIDTEKMILASGDKIYVETPDSSSSVVATISTIGL